MFCDMTLAELLLTELEHEAPLTIRVLERVRPELAAWKPHTRSMSLGTLGSHIAELPRWVLATLDRDALDIGEAAGDGDAPLLVTPAAVVAEFTRNIDDARRVLAGATDEHLCQPWSLLQNKQHLSTRPRYRVLMQDVINHIVHHRAQLTVYLRLNEIPVPALYGPSADES
jgi:uncharacterized damage-inducible protein DinB